MEGLGSAGSVELRAELGGGSGAQAWQHAQLLRSSLREPQGKAKLRFVLRFARK